MATAPTIERVDRDVLHQTEVDLAAACRAAALHGFNEGIDNHFSVGVPGTDDLFLLNRYGPNWTEITAADILTVDLDGKLVEGEGEWEPSAFAIHRGVHFARPTARVVFHTHMPNAAAVAALPEGLDTRLSQTSMYFHGRIGRVSYGAGTDSVEEGVRLGQAVGD